MTFHSLGGEFELMNAIPVIPDEIEARLGMAVRQWRVDAGYSQEELAERAGLSVNGISALERGTRTNPFPHTVQVLAEALSLSPEQRAHLVETATARPDEPLAGARHPGLPAPPTPLVGRVEELDHLLARLADLQRVDGDRHRPGRSRGDLVQGADALHDVEHQLLAGSGGHAERCHRGAEAGCRGRVECGRRQLIVS